MQRTAPSGSSSMRGMARCCCIFLSRSSRNRTISCVKHRILHGLLAKVTCFTRSLNALVSCCGMGRRGRATDEPASMGPALQVVIRQE